MEKNENMHRNDNTMMREVIKRPNFDGREGTLSDVAFGSFMVYLTLLKNEMKMFCERRRIGLRFEFRYSYESCRENRFTSDNQNTR